LNGKQLLTEKADEAAFIRMLAQDRQLDPSEVSNIVVEQPARAPQQVEEEAQP
jgi:hypothetical protein